MVRSPTLAESSGQQVVNLRQPPTAIIEPQKVELGERFPRIVTNDSPLLIEVWISTSTCNGLHYGIQPDFREAFGIVIVQVHQLGGGLY